jgi:hypothetical protein
MMQMIATATMTPIGTTRRRRVWSERGRILPSAICGCAEALTLLPLAVLLFTAKDTAEKLAIRLRFTRENSSGCCWRRIRAGG